MRSMVGHYASLGFGLTATVAILVVGNGSQPWLAAYAGLLIALVFEIGCWIWREANPPPRKRRAGVSPTQARGSTQQARHVPLYAALVSDLGPTEAVRVRCECGRAQILTADTLLATGVPRERKLTDLGRGMRCRRCKERGCALVSVSREKLVQPG
jgi:hypothetical protein